MRDDIDISDAYVILYDKSGNIGYALYNNRASEENNALSSYKLYGGESDPFEYIKLQIPRKKFVQVASPLTEAGALISGINKIRINAMGTGVYIFASADMSGETYTITGYCQAHKLTEDVLASSISGYPFAIIKQILTTTAYGTYISGKFRYQYVPKNDMSDLLTFPAGTTLWYVIQVCAMYLGCRVFFTGSDAYLVDYRFVIPSFTSVSVDGGEGVYAPTGAVSTVEHPFDDTGGVSDTYVSDAVCDFDVIDLYTNDSSRPEYGRVTGQVKLGNEGLTTIMNRVIVTCQGGVKATVESKKAINQYDKTPYVKEMNIPSLRESTYDEVAKILDSESGNIIYNQGSIVASNIVDYRCESQQSIQFTFKEFVKSGGHVHWIPFFTPSARVRAIRDDADDINIFNTSSLNRKIVRPQKLMLSSYSRNFPEGTSTYKFGVISSVNLENKISEMVTTQQNS